MYFNEKDDKFHSGSEERIRVTFERQRTYEETLKMLIFEFLKYVLIGNYSACSYRCKIFVTVEFYDFHGYVEVNHAECFVTCISELQNNLYL